MELKFKSADLGHPRWSLYQVFLVLFLNIWKLVILKNIFFQLLKIAYFQIFLKKSSQFLKKNIFAYLGSGGTYLNILKFSKWYLYKWLSYSSEHNLEKRTFGHPKCCVIVNGAIYLSGYNRVMRKLTKF